MKIFLSWSGDRSKVIAEILANWIEQVIQSTEPWISTELDKGKRWGKEIFDKLNESKLGIICLTKENINNNWILFEAGAISNVPESYVCTFLFDLKPSDIIPPLSLFQSTINTKNDLWKLIFTINRKAVKEGFKGLKEPALKGVFETFFPKLEDELRNVKKMNPINSNKKSNDRTDREIAEESLEILRFVKKNLPPKDVLDQFNIVDKREIFKYYFESYANYYKIKLNGMINEKDIMKLTDAFKKNPILTRLFGDEDSLENSIRAEMSNYLPF